LTSLDRIIVVYRGADGSTNVEYIVSVEELRKRLQKLGISYSEHIPYNKTMT